MKVKLKVDPQWLKLEQKSMSKMKKDYETWSAETLKKAQDAKDLRSLREVFYQLGDRWEWDQTTGDWLSEGEPLDAVGLILRMPGFEPNKERFVVYAVMAYSKGLTDQFDHLGDKERIIIERDTETGKMLGWSTTGHGAMDIWPIDLSRFDSLEAALESGYLVAQPGDHALRIEIPTNKAGSWFLGSRLWEIALGSEDFSSKDIDLLNSHDIEEVLDFKFARYAKAVIELDTFWRRLAGRVVDKAKEKVLDKIPDHIEARNNEALRKIEGLLHILWFKPPATQMDSIRVVYDDLNSEPTPTSVQTEIIPYLGELLYALNDVLEKAQYLKWKSVIDQKSFSESDIFQGLSLSRIAKEAFAVALDDILREHTLAYIGYPERARFIDKAIRIIFGLVILPLRLAVRAIDGIKCFFSGLLKRVRQPKPEIEPVPSEEYTPEESTGN